MVSWSWIFDLDLGSWFHSYKFWDPGPISQVFGPDHKLIIIRCDEKLIPLVTVITKCDRKSLQSVTEYHDTCYKVWQLLHSETQPPACTLSLAETKFCIYILFSLTGNMMHVSQLDAIQCLKWASGLTYMYKIGKAISNLVLYPYLMSRLSKWWMYKANHNLYFILIFAQTHK